MKASPPSGHRYHVWRPTLATNLQSVSLGTAANTPLLTLAGKKRNLQTIQSKVRMVLVTFKSRLEVAVGDGTDLLDTDLLDTLRSNSGRPCAPQRNCPWAWTCRTFLFWCFFQISPRCLARMEAPSPSTALCPPWDEIMDYPP